MKANTALFSSVCVICANSPQAKGRIERAFGTLQDRMVKELRLAGVSSITAAMRGCLASSPLTTRFGRNPANAKNLHRPLSPADDLDEILAWREERTVTRNLTLQYDRTMLLLDPTPLTRGLMRKKSQLLGRAVCGSVQRNRAGFQGVRQDPDSAAGRDRRQQAALGGVGARQSIGASEARACRPALTVEQPRSTGSALEGAPRHAVVAAPV
jgi:hypothetical protein